MKKLTNKQLNKIKNITFRYDLHVKMWDWLAKNPDKDKYDYFDLYPDEKEFALDYECFACAYNEHVIDKLSIRCRNECFYCPFEVKNEVYTEKCCLGGRYKGWLQNSDDLKQRSEYARQIRDLPLNPMYNFKDVK